MSREHRAPWWPVTEISSRCRCRFFKTASLCPRNQRHHTVPSLLKISGILSLPREKSTVLCTTSSNVHSAVSCCPKSTINNGLDFGIVLRFAVLFFIRRGFNISVLNHSAFIFERAMMQETDRSVQQVLPYGASSLKAD